MNKYSTTKTTASPARVIIMMIFIIFFHDFRAVHADIRDRDGGHRL